MIGSSGVGKGGGAQRGRMGQVQQQPVDSGHGTEVQRLQTRERAESLSGEFLAGCAVDDRTTQCEVAQLAQSGSEAEAREAAGVEAWASQPQRLQSGASADGVEQRQRK